MSLEREGMERAREGFGGGLAAAEGGRVRGVRCKEEKEEVVVGFGSVFSFPFPFPIVFLPLPFVSSMLLLSLSTSSSLSLLPHSSLFVPCRPFPLFSSSPAVLSVPLPSLPSAKG